MTQLFVALDFDSAETAVRTAQTLAPHVDGFKVGLQLLLGPGPTVISALHQLEKPIFADAKLFDIPNTVKAAAHQLGRLGPRYLTVHAAGGEAMVEAAVEGLTEGAGGHPAGVLAITVLTSLDQDALSASGVRGSIGEQVGRMARLAARAGAEGAVTSVRECRVVAEAAPDLLRVTPGIRADGESSQDQARAGTVSEALARGSNLIVVGRPITRAADPVAAAQTIAALLTEAPALS